MSSDLVELYSNDYEAEVDQFIFSIDTIDNYFSGREPASKFTYIAFLNIRLFSKAYDVLMQLQRQGVKQLEQDFNDIQCRLSEQRFGTFNFEELEGISQNSYTYRTLIADFVNPNVKFENDKLTAISAIQAGALLIVQKAVAFSDFVDKTRAEVELFRELHPKFVNVRNLNEKHYFFPYLVDGFSKYEQDSEGFWLRDFILGEMYSVLEFQQVSTEHDFCSEGKISGFGVFPYLQGISLQCNFNAHISFVGDVLVVTAVKNINKGEAISGNHISPFCSLAEKHFQEEMRCEFCDCKICKIITEDNRNLIDLMIFECMLVINKLFGDLEDDLVEEDSSHLFKELFALVGNVEQFLDQMFGRCFREPLLPVYFRMILYLTKTSEMTLARTTLLEVIDNLGFRYSDILEDKYEMEPAYAETSSFCLSNLNFFYHLFTILNYVVDTSGDLEQKETAKGEIDHLVRFMTFWSRRFGMDEIVVNMSE